MFVTFFDTCMVSLAAMFVWRISPYYVFFPWLTIACLDGMYLSSALTKVPNGAWFTLTLSAVLTAFFILWRFGKEQQWAAEAEDRFPTTHFVEKQEDGLVRVTPNYGGGTLSSIKGFGIFFDKAGTTTPPVFSQFVVKLVAAPDVMVLFHLRPLETPSVPPDNRYRVSRLAIPNCYRLIVRHGYSDEVINPDLSSLIYEQVHKFIQSSNVRGPVNRITGSVLGYEQQAKATSAPVLPSTTDADNTETTHSSSSATDTDDNLHGKDGTSALEQKLVKEKQIGDAVTLVPLAKLEEAYAHQVLYIIGKEQMKIKAGTGLFRKVLLHMFLWIRDNTRTKIANLRVPTDRVFEVGFVKDI